VKSTTPDYVATSNAGDYPDLLTSAQVAQRSGITYRMLDNWVRNEMITPVVHAHGSGSARLFEPDVVEQIQELLVRIEQCPFDHGYGKRI